MQTFLPFFSFARSAECLDNKRLGKQRVEVLQILNVLQRGGSGGWVNHPAVRMWRGYEAGLAFYGMIICNEWRRRGFNDTVLDKIQSTYLNGSVNLPLWLGDDAFHRSHQSNLLRKDPAHYSKYFPSVRHDLPYVWPVPKETK